ncbi:TolC family protein [Pontibacter oryzae]|uniref:TolC family protein n=1 Tax=Pontibacter oryzae TaxID=2304593 RepID=A0A399SEK2_9BACT|nr:TolC family protein [Pontibacter oryzae]RIJ42526.1 hypothetical protein D1627_01285 [Pontibacter oryzae]
MKHIYILLLLLGSVPVVSLAQTAEPGITAIQRRLPPLDTVLLWAETAAPLVKIQKSYIDKNTAFISNAKKQWLQGLTGDLSYGASDQVFLLQENGGAQSINNFNNGYRASITMRVNLYDVVGRKSLVEMAQHEYEVSRHRHAATQQEVRAKAIALYFETESAQRVLQIKSEVLQVAKLNRMYSEKKFNEANIDVTEFARIIEIATKAEMEFEVAKRELYTSFYLLNELTGKHLEKSL